MLKSTRYPLMSKIKVFVSSFFGLSAFILASNLTPSYATGDECAGIQPYVCVTVFGKGGTVKKLGARRGLTPQMCNYYAKWKLYNSKGKLVRTTKSKTQKGCTYGRAWFQKNIKDIRLGIGGKVCVTWFEGGSQTGGNSLQKTWLKTFILRKIYFLNHQVS